MGEAGYHYEIAYVKIRSVHVAGSAGAIPLSGKRVFVHVGLIQRPRRLDLRCQLTADPIVKQFEPVLIQDRLVDFVAPASRRLSWGRPRPHMRRQDAGATLHRTAESSRGRGT